jgi:TM2 domain-containing membrane protein YozV
MTVCYIHPDVQAIGTCVGCGKFICEDCTTEIKGKNYCKTCLDELFEEKNKKIEKLEDNKASQPMVFMNAGGGGGASSSSSSSSSAASSGGGAFTGRYTRSKVAAGLLGIFLGGFGVHKFYLGRWGWGIIYLLLCWTYVPAIVGFIEGIVYLVSNDENFARKHDKGYQSFGA